MNSQAKKIVGFCDVDYKRKGIVVSKENVLLKLQPSARKGLFIQTTVM